ncbi:hypothetical protein AB0F72_38040 [Actinoplanes sp. NPDC023936]|uniref:hypothetical protein n=1 Tax=Actinoplanes sp. NPDC023936 TaxID=3154910 RepID=UPI0033E8CA20
MRSDDPTARPHGYLTSTDDSTAFPPGEGDCLARAGAPVATAAQRPGRCARVAG